MFKKILLKISDLELIKKPQSTKIREQVVKDILSVDPEKWFNPKLPDGKVNPHCGTINKDGIAEPLDIDLYYQVHPDLDYKIHDVPLGTCKEGEWENVTKKDCELIREALYQSRGSSLLPHNVSNIYLIFWNRTKDFLYLGGILIALILGLIYFTKWVLFIIGLSFFISSFVYAVTVFERVLKEL